MKKLFYVLTLTFAVALSAATSAGNQTRRNRATTAAPPAANTQATARVLASLPVSDAVMVVDVRRLLSEALPRAFNNDAAELARINSEIDKFKATTGLDARLFERIAVGVSYKQTATGKTLVETVAIARGTFKPGALAAAVPAATQSRMQQQKYAGKTIYVFEVNAQVKLLGLFNLRVSDVAVSVLDANTVAIGKLERVRAAIDANAGRGGRVSPEIASLATRDASAIIGMGGDVPASLTQKLDIGNISKSIAAVRQFYSTLGTTANGFNMLTALRTDNAGAAKSLSSTLTGLKQLAPYAIGQMKPARARPLQSLVESTKVNAEGNDVLITVELAQVDVAALLASF